MASGSRPRRRGEPAASGGGRMRISELVQRTGVSKETIHFYLREGLLPRPKMARSNLAFYDESHVERLELIRRLQTESYLPLEVIKRLLRGGRPRGGGEDLALLSGLYHLLGHGAGGPIARAELKRRAGVSEAVLERAERARLVGDGAGGFDADDLRALELVAEAGAALGRQAGAELELVVESFALVARHLESLARDEARLIFGRLLTADEPLDLLEGLRRAREAQSRFLAHERGRGVKRAISSYVAEIERAIERSGGPSAFSLSDGKLAALGRPEARARLLQRAEEEAEAAELLCLADFTIGRFAEVAETAARAERRFGARPRLTLWRGAAIVERGDLDGGAKILDEAVRAGAPPLARALLGAAKVRQCRRTIEEAGAGSALKQAAAGLADLAAVADAPGETPLLVGERARARLARGRVYASLPPFFGVLHAGLEDLRSVRGHGPLPDPLEPLGVGAALRGNAAWFFGAALAEAGDPAGPVLLDEAAAVDPDGPLGQRRRPG